MSQVDALSLIKKLREFLPPKFKAHLGGANLLKKYTVTRPIKVVAQRVAFGPRPKARFFPSKTLIVVYDEKALPAFREAIDKCNSYFGLT